MEDGCRGCHIHFLPNNPGIVPLFEADWASGQLSIRKGPRQVHPSTSAFPTGGKWFKRKAIKPGELWWDLLDHTRESWLHPCDRKKPKTMLQCRASSPCSAQTCRQMPADVVSTWAPDIIGERGKKGESEMEGGSTHSGRQSVCVRDDKSVTKGGGKKKQWAQERVCFVLLQCPWTGVRHRWFSSCCLLERSHDPCPLLTRSEDNDGVMFVLT